MNIYLIQRIEETEYDYYEGFVIAEINEMAARKLASNIAVEEPIFSSLESSDKLTWLDETKSTCSWIGENHSGLGAALILSSYKPG